MRIIAKNLVKIYGDRCVVNDNSFYIDKGEVVSTVVSSELNTLKGDLLIYGSKLDAINYISDDYLIELSYIYYALYNDTLNVKSVHELFALYVPAAS